MSSFGAVPGSKRWLLGVKRLTDMFPRATLVIGGGIRSAEQAKRAADAGADWIVTGTLTEDAADLEELRTRISAVVNAIKGDYAICALFGLLRTFPTTRNA